MAGESSVLLRGVGTPPVSWWLLSADSSWTHTHTHTHTHTLSVSHTLLYTSLFSISLLYTHTHTHTHTYTLCLTHTLVHISLLHISLVHRPNGVAYVNMQGNSISYSVVDILSLLQKTRTS